MKVTYNWLKDFVDIGIPAEKLAEKLTMAGLEVTSLSQKDGDWVFELEITSNRPDWLSIIGIAREIAAITGKKLKLDTGKGKRASSSKHTVSKFEIKIESKKDCSLYTARIIEGVRVRPSPGWLKKRLELIGVRSVNNIVDITNYVLVETGQPLHAFDLDKIKQCLIFVRRAAASEKITLIDGQEKALDKDILVIADKQRPVAIAGIMGGSDSEVGAGSKNILLEAAVFNPILTRRASRKLGLSSESSYRFERGIDIENVDVASLRATSLIQDLAGGEFIVAKSTTRQKIKAQSISLRVPEVNRVLGKNYKASEIKRILACLGFAVKQQGAKAVNIKAPSFRSDIKQPVDLIEEIARISGYDNIPARLPRMVPQEAISVAFDKAEIIKDIVISQGANEVITYSLISKILANQFGYTDEQLISIANPLTNQQEVLRPSLIPGLVTCIEYNLNQRQKDIRIFEISNIFQNGQEKSFFGMAYSGNDKNAILPEIIHTLQLLLKRLGIRDYELRERKERSHFYNDPSLSLIINRRACANLGSIKSKILKALDVKEFIYAIGLDLEILFNEIERIQKKYIPLPVYPQVIRDISIVLGRKVFFADIKNKIKAGNIAYLEDVKYVEYYEDKQSLTLSCTYRSADRTLTGEEVDIAHQKVLDILKNK
ncbi:phenylalanine--tRNA ligase subunit beta, partial [Candidatus Omnitrophota bacterium]